MADCSAFPKPCFVYAIGSFDGPQKIGVANDVESRLSSMQTANHTALRILAAVAVSRGNAFSIEGYAHWLLRESHVRGEWFSVSPDEAARAVMEAAKAVAHGAEIPKPQRILGRRGPKPVHGDRIMLRLPAALLGRVDRVAGKNERSGFIREAIDRELTRRERTAAKPKP